ncbi:MAG: right-handed parallel beta-helix repeat-containing protein [Phycisphaerales bacterium]|nr:right-handed parallel beta-helix repeat-containing protein [Phycisphaerales bacterium]
MLAIAVLTAVALSHTPPQPEPVRPEEAAGLPIVLVDRDNIRITESCRLRIADGVFIADEDNNGVIHVEADGVTVYWPTERGGRELLARADEAAFETMSGIGLRIDGHRDVTIRGAHLHRFKIGLWATSADGLTLEDCDVSGGYAMRLGSTPAAEDSADWLWPHRNDENQWATNYGAGIWIEDSASVTVARCFARRRQNGLILENVADSRIFDNDFSFLSGWGIAMWRSSRNVVSRNAVDFCIRGYSHGVYNRGQDSAGILLFEQCNENLFIENSATHGGDGLFGFGGREALGETPAPEADAAGKPWTYQRRGCNDNVFVGNDFSYAAAHGLELTFSFGNVIVNNRFVENAICGIWGGYSQDTLIHSNEFTGNGGAGYGLERGGVNIEHSERNVISQNRFSNNAAGVHLWHDADPGLMSGVWAAANHTHTRDNIVESNAFVGDRVGIHLRDAIGTVVAANEFEGVEQPVLAERSDVVGPGDGADASRPEPPVLATLGGLVPGESRPVGARAALAGRHNIIMGEYFPWDHERPMVRRGADENGAHVYEILGTGDPSGVNATVDAGVVDVIAPGDTGIQRVRVAVAPEPGADVTPYTLTLDGIASGEFTGVLLRVEWDVRAFASPCDPRTDPDAWRAAADTGVRGTLHNLRLRFGNGSIGNLRGEGLNSNEGTGMPPGPDHFGTIATTSLRLPPGRWRITTLSDDGVRVYVNDEAIIDNWTWHGPTRDVGEFAVPEPSEPQSSPNVPIPADPAAPLPLTQIRVEHFELDGYAVLEVEIEPVRE